MATALGVAAPPMSRLRAGQAPASMRSSPTASLKANSSFLGASLPLRTPFQHAAVQPLSARRRSVKQVRAAQQVQVEIDKPIGLNFKKANGKGGGLTVTKVSGNAAKSGISTGDTVVYASSFFGDELWPSDDVNFTKSAINAAPSPVCLVYVKGENNDVMVKRLPKKPAPKRFGRKLTAAQKELATHICVDCGWIYAQSTPFEELATDFRCPQCKATKKRFARYDADSGKKVGGVEGSAATIATVTVGLAGLGVLLYLGLNV